MGLEINTVYHEDCLSGMNRISDKSVDMILCDLPYGTTDCKWDVIIPFAELWAHYERIIKDNGAIVLMSAEPFTSLLICSNLKMFRYDLIWDKVGSTGFLNAKKMPLRRHENILVFYKKLPVYNPQKTPGKAYSKTRSKVAEVYQKVNNFTSNSDGLMYPTSILEMAKHGCIGSNHDRQQSSFHPTQKPVGLFSWLIRTYTTEGDLILDNCMGSGTTAIACINENRHFLGFEKDENFFKLSIDRINAATNTSQNIAEVEVKNIQPDLFSQLAS